MRRPFISGNWKMFKTVKETKDYFSEFNSLVKGVDDRDIVLGVPSVALTTAVKSTEGTNVAISAQNCHWEAEGAFTGEISVSMIKEAGAEYVIVGHSERRQFFGETDESVNKKVKSVLAGGLFPVMCIGESQTEREAEKTLEVILSQLTRGLEGLTPEQFQNVIIAYEPVWAIGTGLTATPEQAQEVHAYIRNEIKKIFNENIAKELKILYGGSVKPGNIGDLMAKPDLDGALVGGASLKPEDFASIVNF